jgi:hypothetical protein
MCHLALPAARSGVPRPMPSPSNQRTARLLLLWESRVQRPAASAARYPAHPPPLPPQHPLRHRPLPPRRVSPRAYFLTFSAGLLLLFHMALSPFLRPVTSSKSSPTMRMGYPGRNCLNLASMAVYLLRILCFSKKLANPNVSCWTNCMRLSQGGVFGASRGTRPRVRVWRSPSRTPVDLLF